MLCDSRMWVVEAGLCSCSCERFREVSSLCDTGHQDPGKLGEVAQSRDAAASHSHGRLSNTSLAWPYSADPA